MVSVWVDKMEAGGMPATQILWDLRKSCILGVSDSPSSLHWLIKVIQSYVDQSPSAPTQVACDDLRWMTSWAEVLSGGRDRSQAPLVFRKGTGAPFCSAWAVTIAASVLA